MPRNPNALSKTQLKLLLYIIEKYPTKYFSKWDTREVINNAYSKPLEGLISRGYLSMGINGRYKLTEKGKNFKS